MTRLPQYAPACSTHTSAAADGLSYSHSLAHSSAGRPIPHTTALHKPPLIKMRRHRTPCTTHTSAVAVGLSESHTLAHSPAGCPSHMHHTPPRHQPSLSYSRRLAHSPAGRPIPHAAALHKPPLIKMRRHRSPCSTHTSAVAVALSHSRRLAHSPAGCTSARAASAAPTSAAAGCGVTLHPPTNPQWRSHVIHSTHQRA